MPEDIKIISIFLLYFLVFGVPLYLLFHLPKIIRAIRMKLLAKKYSLKFDRMIGLKIIDPLGPSGKEKRNVLSGMINGKNIEIYDYITRQKWFFVIIYTRGGVYRHHTTFIKNNNKVDIVGLFGGSCRVSIGKIKKWLDSV